ncbi:MAG: dihydropyrimidinase [Candidatus Marinimicrobia bacterium]|nr:dihydropyrimidinase [Candidatus Neomarinimicrobiota bacterium]
MSVLIKNGRIITASDDYQADIFIQNDKISIIGENLSIPADKIIDASGKYVIPGGIDPHTHLDMPFMGTVSSDDFVTGTRAAAHGGTTTIIDFAIQTKGHSALEGLETWHAKAAGKTAVDYGFHMILTDTEGDRISELKTLIGEGVTSYKLFMAYPGVLFMDDANIYRTMREAGDNGAIICMHAENGIVIDEIVRNAVVDGKTEPKWHAATRPDRMEAEAVHRTIAIGDVADVPVYIVHLTSAAALDQVALARNDGQAVFAETCPQYLFLDESYYEKDNFEGAKYVMSPPLREKWNQAELWNGLANGNLQVVSTDHCTFRFKDQKPMGKDLFTKIPNGAPGLENRMSLIYQGGVVDGNISLNTFVKVTSTAAAKIFGLYPRKGTIAVGSDADVVIFNPDRKETISVDNPITHNMNVDYNAYEGFEVTGVSETVLSRGKMVIEDNKYVGKEGDGEFIKRGLFSDY